MAEVGKREVRVDAFDKATGRTKYYEDLMQRVPGHQILSLIHI